LWKGRDLGIESGKERGKMVGSLTANEMGGSLTAGLVKEMEEVVGD